MHSQERRKKIEVAHNILWKLILIDNDFIVELIPNSKLYRVVFFNRTAGFSVIFITYQCILNFRYKFDCDDSH